MAKTIAQINERIAAGKAVVVTAEEIIGIVDEKGLGAAAAEVDVVTTGTFGPMCSSGAFISTGHASPRMKFSRAWLNNVPAYAGVAAVDLYIGATELCEEDPENRVYPGLFKYGGAHVIEELVSGREVHFRAEAYGTDCYPRKEIEAMISLETVNDASLVNPRNCYQNYNVAVNRDAAKVIYTYMGALQPRMANANYCSAGQLSPLLCDPLYRTIGVGTRIFLGGGVGHVYSQGTQHAPDAERTEGGVPKGGSGTLGVCGDLKGMSAEWLRGASLVGYGVSMAVGVGVPIPILDVETLRHAAVRDEEILAPVVDYSTDYPSGKPKPLAHVNYKDLKSGKITVDGKEIVTAGLSSYYRAVEIAETLKSWIADGKFLLAQAVQPLPGPGEAKPGSGLVATKS